LLSYKKEDPLEGLFKLKRPMPGQEPWNYTSNWLPRKNLIMINNLSIMDSV
jgi:hypothetical protein